MNQLPYEVLDIEIMIIILTVEWFHKKVLLLPTCRQQCLELVYEYMENLPGS